MEPDPATDRERLGYPPRNISPRLCFKRLNLAR